MTLDGIVSDYIGKHREGLKREMHDYEIQKSLSAVIRKAALPDIKHKHQQRIPRVALKEAECKLQQLSERLAAAVTFDDLHRSVLREIGGIHRIGSLAIYDIAHRIGSFLNKAPAFVYLHRGTKEGAGYLGLKGNRVDPSNLPEEFALLTAAEIEDCLCRYKGDIKTAGQSVGGEAHPNPFRSTCAPGESKVRRCR